MLTAPSYRKRIGTVLGNLHPLENPVVVHVPANLSRSSVVQAERLAGNFAAIKVQRNKSMEVLVSCSGRGVVPNYSVDGGSFVF